MKIHPDNLKYAAWLAFALALSAIVGYFAGSRADLPAVNAEPQGLWISWRSPPPMDMQTVIAWEEFGGLYPGLVYVIHKPDGAHWYDYKTDAEITRPKWWTESPRAAR